jgi:pimeloyl-ACP methyl ester carboxylesterase
MKIRNLQFYCGVLFLITLSLACKRETEKVAISSDGVQISFTQQGKGRPAIVFVHGWTNPKGIWEDQMIHFAQKYRVAAIDLPGSGESGNNRAEWTMQAFGDDVTKVINEMKLDEVVLVGFSMGASVVVEAANLIPEKVIGVVLVDDLKDPELKFPPEMISIIDSTLMDLVNNMTNEKLLAAGFYKNNPDSAFKRLSALYHGVSHIGWHESLQGYFSWLNEDMTESLKNLRTPVTSINSNMDPTNMEALRKYIPGFQAKIMTGVGHMVFWDNPEEFNRLLEDTIQEFLAIRNSGGTGRSY